MSEFEKHQGQCHCGAVQFEVETTHDVVVDNCNCSICAKTGFLHLIVPASRFHILSGEYHLTTYTFNTGIAQHLFCRTCGVKPFYVPRSNPDGWSVNFRCLNRDEFGDVDIRPFDGQNWEANADALAGLSKD
jgi:hypothetical protein